MTVVILFLHSTRHAPNSYPQLLVVWKRLPQVLFACVAWKKGVYLRFPVLAVNESDTKHMFDNRYGHRSKFKLMRLYVQPYLVGRPNTCGLRLWLVRRGVASRAHGMGANVIVTEIDPTRALEAGDGRLPRDAGIEAAAIGDIFITVTGNVNVIDRAHLERMKNGALIANSGHFNDEINIPELEKLATKKRRVRDFVDEYTYADGRQVHLLAEGRLVNLSAAEGHPAKCDGYELC